MINLLLSTYNGEKYLKEQLDSLLAQTYKNIEIIVRDDGSSDGTLDILNTYDVVVLDSSENVGPKKSFASLLEYAVQNTDSDYFMFCDQDDVWNQDKIENIYNRMLELESKYLDLPLLVHSDLEVVDENLVSIHKSFMYYQHIDAKQNKLNNLLIQNTVTGCTMMINRKLVEIALPIPKEAIMHDWWLGLVATKFGKISYLDETTIKYRQHVKNSVGAKQFNFRYALDNINKANLLKDNISQAKAFLEMYRKNLDEETIQILDEFTALKSKSFYQRRKILLKHKLLKQGFIRNIGLLLKI